MTTKRYFKHRIAYAGQRLSGRSLFHVFSVDGGDNLLAYSKVRRPLVLGEIYEGKMTRDKTMDFGSFVSTGERVDSKLAEMWSIEDASHRRAKTNGAAYRKQKAAAEKTWQKRLEPLRDRYRVMATPQKRAMRQLLIEFLES